MADSAENDRGFDALVAYERAKVEESEAYWSQECGYRTERVTCLVERWEHASIIKGHEFGARVIPPEQNEETT